MPSVPGGTPMALGVVTVTSAGTPVPILENFSDIDTDVKRVTAAWKGKVSSITIKSAAINTGTIFIGNPAMVVSTGVGVFADIPVGGSMTIQSNDSMNLFNLTEFYVDADNNDDQVYVTAIRV